MWSYSLIKPKNNGSERWLVYLCVQRWGGHQTTSCSILQVFNVRMEGKVVAEQIFPLQKHYLKVCWEKNKYDEKGKNKNKKNRITNVFAPWTHSEHRPVGLPRWLAVLHSLQGRWNSEAGRGVQCVVSKFCMYFRAWWLKERDGRRRRHWDRKVWEAVSGKGRAWLH